MCLEGWALSIGVPLSRLGSLIDAFGAYCLMPKLPRPMKGCTRLSSASALHLLGAQLR